MDKLYLFNFDIKPYSSSANSTGRESSPSVDKLHLELIPHEQEEISPFFLVCAVEDFPISKPLLYMMRLQIQIVGVRPSEKHNLCNEI